MQAACNLLRIDLNDFISRLVASLCTIITNPEIGGYNITNTTRVSYMIESLILMSHELIS